MLVRLDDFLLALPRWSFRILSIVMLANILSMLLMNVLGLGIGALPLVYAGAAIVAFVLVPRLGEVEKGSRIERVDRVMVLRLAFALFAVCAIARFGYLLEPLRHNLVQEVVWDDLWHFQEINALVHGGAFPVTSTFDSRYYFSFYYAPWMLPAALYAALPFWWVSIKMVYAVTTAFYILTAIFSLLEVLFQTVDSKRHLYGVVFLAGLWGGLESIATLTRPLRHHTSWMRDLGFRLEYSTFPTLLLFVIHHLLAATALLMAAYLWRLGGTGRPRSLVTIALLCVFAFYSSVFVVLGAIPLALVLLWQSRTRVVDAGIAVGVMLLAAFPLLWLYLGKIGSVGFLVPLHPNVSLVIPVLKRGVTLGIAGGFGLFLVLLVLNFLPHVVLLVRAKAAVVRDDWEWVAVSALFLISTYWVGYSLFNNYCMRGSILPIMVLSWVAARYLPALTPGLLGKAVLAVGVLAGLNEIAIFDGTMLHNLVRAKYGEAGRVVLGLNENRHVGQIQASQVQGFVSQEPEVFYHIEKTAPGVEREMLPSDEETLSRGPSGVWDFERHGKSRK